MTNLTFLNLSSPSKITENCVCKLKKLEHINIKNNKNFNYQKLIIKLKNLKNIYQGINKIYNKID